MKSEPVIAVGLVEHAASISLHLLDAYTDSSGRRFEPGEYLIECRSGKIICTTTTEGACSVLHLTGDSPLSRFRISITIGINFHWQQKKEYTFCGSIRMVPQPDNLITVINDVPLESYILSVSCSEMSAGSPVEFLKAHSIISRSWLLAQLEAKKSQNSSPSTETNLSGECIRWYDREAHTDFDVCADDHCQRYQGIDMLTTGLVSQAVEATRGQVLMFEGKPCDARFSKCCGGVTENFTLAWSNTPHPYLIPITDGPDPTLPVPSLCNETAARQFITGRAQAYCNCTDPAILSSVLNSYDQTTRDFFRWTVRISHDECARLINEKLDRDIGRITALIPVKRGESSRLEKLRITGDNGSIVIGKELEIRRALSSTHLYSSAFVIDTEGPPARPDSFILTGAGWGHGVGLCQIGAAVMACKGIGHKKILTHYYPGSELIRLYE